jgi:hypothetical protein
MASDPTAVGLPLRRCSASAVGSILCSVSKWHVPRRRRRSPTPEYLDLEEDDGGLDRVFKFSSGSFMLNFLNPCVIPCIPLGLLVLQHFLIAAFYRVGSPVDRSKKTSARLGIEYSLRSEI